MISTGISKLYLTKLLYKEFYVDKCDKQQMLLELNHIVFLLFFW